jgi:hypothetical protein
MAALRFGTLVTCIDGRVQRPTILWMREHYGLDFVDVISEPGPDKLMAEGWPSDVVPVRKKVAFSVQAHASRLVALCGHYDCAGNPATPEVHRQQIGEGVRLLRSWALDADVIGLWINEHWQVEVVEPPQHTRESGAR